MVIAQKSMVWTRLSETPSVSTRKNVGLSTQDSCAFNELWTETTGVLIALLLTSFRLADD